MDDLHLKMTAKFAFLVILLLLVSMALAYVQQDQSVPLLFDDITLMLGYKPLAIWKPLCKFVAPLSTLVCWILTLIAHSSLKYDSGEPFPVWVSYFGVAIGLMSVVPFPVAALIELFSLPGPFLMRLKSSVSPTSEWGPAIKKYKKCEDDMPMSVIETS